MKEKKYLTYEEIRELALKEQIADNRVSVGMWAKFKGYKQQRIQRNKELRIYYYLPCS